MKFLSNFDTQLEADVVHRYKELYGKDSVLTIHRAKIFRVFNCLIPTIGIACMVLIIGLIVGRDSGDETFDTIKSLL